MKKILLIDYAIDKLGGVERVINTLAISLSELYYIDICSVYKYSESPFFNYPENINRRYLINLSKLPSTKSKSMVAFIFFRSFEKIFEMTFYKKAIKTYCNQEINKYDVVIFGRTKAAVDFLPYMENYNGKIIVRDATHLYDTAKRNQAFMKTYFPRKVDTFVVSSEESIVAYRNFFGDETIKIRKIYNPLGIEPKNSHNGECKLITGVGRYSRQKGFENLIYAFSIVHKKNPEWRLALLGTGRKYGKYKKLCKRLGIIQSVEFRKSDNIVEDYDKTGIYIMSSRYEGYANALVEALACGVPSISYDWYMGVEDIIINVENGIIVPLKNRKKYFQTNNVDKEDVENLAKAITNLIEDKQLRISLGKNAVKIAKSREKECIINEWIKIIEEIN